MDLKLKITELAIKAEMLNSNMLMAYNVIVEGSNLVEEYEWSLSDLHNKTLDLKDELRELEDYLYHHGKEEPEMKQAS